MIEWEMLVYRRGGDCHDNFDPASSEGKPRTKYPVLGLFPVFYRALYHCYKELGEVLFAKWIT